MVKHTTHFRTTRTWARKPKGKKEENMMNEGSIKRLIKQEIKQDQEEKHFDNFNAVTAIGNAYTITNVLTDVPYSAVAAQGDQTRIGDVVKPVSIEINMELFASGVQTTIRVILFRWYPQNAALVPAVANILDGTGTYGPGTLLADRKSVV